MKVALVTNSFPTLSETFVYNQAAGLQRAGIDVSVVAMTPSRDAALFADFDGPRFDGPIRYGVLAGGVTRTATRLAAHLTELSGRDVKLWREARRLYGATKRALRAYLLALPCGDADVIHFEYSGIAVAWLDVLPLLRPARLVISCRGTAERVTPLVDPDRLESLRDVFAKVDRVHCVSESMRETCGGYGLSPAKAFVNHPAIDTARFRRSTPYAAKKTGPYQLLSTGRLTWLKGLEYALVAVRKLVDAGHDVRYEIIGSGLDEPSLRYATHDLGLVDRVTFSGKRSSTEVRAALERCDLYLLPSLSEGISNAALEAMAMEIPVISTSTGGMAEAITDGVDGIIVGTRDADALTERIAALLAAPERRVELGRAARQRVERDFTLERQIRVFVDEYRALTQG